jgi:hypothetical protein
MSPRKLPLRVTAFFPAPKFSMQCDTSLSKIEIVKFVKMSLVVFWIVMLYSWRNVLPPSLGLKFRKGNVRYNLERRHFTPTFF